MGTPLSIAVAMLPTPQAHDGLGATPVLGGRRASGTKRQVGLPDVVAHRLSPSLAEQDGTAGCEGRLLPTPDAGVSPRGHGRRGGRPGNGRQSGAGLDATARALAGAEPDWGAYRPAVRRHERVTGRPAPAPSEPGREGRRRLSAAFAEWMMMLPGGWVTGVTGLPRTAQLTLLGNGVVPAQAAMALRLLIAVAAAPAPGAAGRAAGG